MDETSSVVAVYETYRGIETAVAALRKIGFALEEVSILGNEHYEEESVLGYYRSGREMRYWGSMRPFWGRLWKRLAGAGFFVVPGVGPILIAGPAATWVANVLEGAFAVPGLSVVGAALYNRGVPKDLALRCEAALKTDRLVIVALGDAAGILETKDALRAIRPAEVDVHLVEAVMSAA